MVTMKVTSRGAVASALIAASALGVAISGETAQAQSSAVVTVRSAEDAMTVLSQLPVKGRAPKTGYSRKQFGSAWLDTDRNGCDARNDVLQRDFVNETFKAGTHNCKVIGGEWRDPYSGETYYFDHQPSEVSVDHVVALSDAWQKGAQQLSTTQRKNFANDPLNLIPTTKRINSRKSDSDAASWLPPNKAFRCHYVARQIAVKQKYGLWVTQAEAKVMKTILQKPQCAGTTLPNGQDRVL